MDMSDIQALMEPVANMVARYELAEATTCKVEAARPDTDFDCVPLQEPLGLTGLVRHASRLTGFSYAELDPMLDVDQGFSAGLAVGDVGRPGLLGHLDPTTLIDFINVSRAAVASIPGVDLRSWWEDRRHNKRSSAIELLLEGRQRDKIFDAYRDELTELPPSAVRRGHDDGFTESSIFVISR